MDILIAFLIAVLLVAVIAVVGQPLRTARREPSAISPGRDELEAAREAKYREIRDTELDYRTGKLSRADYETIDGALRAEAVEILNRLAALEEESPTPRGA
jgi:hypothetical protein